MYFAFFYAVGNDLKMCVRLFHWTLFLIQYYRVLDRRRPGRPRQHGQPTLCLPPTRHDRTGAGHGTLSQLPRDCRANTGVFLRNCKKVE